MNYWCLEEERNEDERHWILSISQEIGNDSVYQVAVNNKVIPMTAHGLMESVPFDELPGLWYRLTAMWRRSLAFFCRAEWCMVAV